MSEVQYVALGVWPPEGETRDSVSGSGLTSPQRKSLTHEELDPREFLASAEGQRYMDVFLDYNEDPSLSTADSTLLFELRTRNRTLLRNLHTEEERRKVLEKDFQLSNASVKSENVALQRKLNGSRQHVQALQMQLKNRDHNISEARGQLADLREKYKLEHKKSAHGWNIVSRNLAMIQKMRKGNNELKKLRMSDKMSRIATEKDAMMAFEKLKPLEQKNCELQYENNLYKIRKKDFNNKMTELRKQVELGKDNATRWEEALKQADKEKSDVIDELCQRDLKINELQEEKTSLLQDLENTTNELQSTSESLDKLRSTFDELSLSNTTLNRQFNALQDKNGKDSLRLDEAEIENTELKDELSGMRVSLQCEQDKNHTLQKKYDALVKRCLI